MAHNIRTSRRGFSLIEVMMAVLILGLGLLGLGAIMPAVVKQQRVGTDQVFGSLAGRSAAAFIEGVGRLRDRHPGTGGPWNQSPWKDKGFLAAWAESIPSGVGGGTYDANYAIPLDGTWLVVPVDVDNLFTSLDSAGNVRIDLADRLYPGVASGMEEPQFVFDLAVRRVAPADMGGSNPQVSGGKWNYRTPGNTTLQFAVITRRIDQGIRVPSNLAGQTKALFKSMLDTGLSTSDRRVPVSEDDRGNPLLSGDFRGSSNGRYAMPYLVNVRSDPMYPPDTIEFTGANESALFNGTSRQGTTRSDDVAFAQIVQANQVVIDNLGNSYTVQGIDDRGATGTRLFRVSPPLPSEILTTPARLKQLLVCPQPPAAVNIITVTP